MDSGKEHPAGSPEGGQGMRKEIDLNFSFARGRRRDDRILPYSSLQHHASAVWLQLSLLFHSPVNSRFRRAFGFNYRRFYLVSGKASPEEAWVCGALGGRPRHHDVAERRAFQLEERILKRAMELVMEGWFCFRVGSTDCADDRLPH